jgi:hypothetical protein
MPDGLIEECDADGEHDPEFAAGGSEPLHALGYFRADCSSVAAPTAIARGLSAIMVHISV